MESEEQEPDFRNMGCQILCSQDVADEIAQQLREAVSEILDGYTDDGFSDYGVD
jgi:hypothetical protein